MIFKTIFGLLLALVMVGCGDMTSYEKSTAPMAATSEKSTAPMSTTSEKSTAAVSTTSEKEVLRYLQSLQRVQLKLVRRQSPAEREAMRRDAIKQLHELLPQLDTAGTTDNWTLEFAFGRSYVASPPAWMYAVPPRPLPMAAVRDCRCRLVRTVVMDGRAATAIAYEGPPVTGGGTWPALQEHSEKQLLRYAIAVFAKAWRQANPDTHQK